MNTTAIFDARRMNYETPAEGISIGEYIARRMHKTTLLTDVPALLARDSAEALARIALYAAAASTSFGPALYQPSRTARGTLIRTSDPQTGAQVDVTCEEELRFAFAVQMENVGRITGRETINGTTVGLHGLGMPAPTRIEFVSVGEAYRATMMGIIHSELAPRLKTWRIRGHGALDLQDSDGNRGRLSLDRSGLAFVSISRATGGTFVVKERLAS